MELILEVLNYKGTPPFEPLSAHFNEAGGSIGRKSDNRLYLPDKDQIISRHHGHIQYQDGVFVYQDSSLHGTELCGQNRVLSHGSTPLANGDRLKIGEYELLVRIRSAAQDITQPVFAAFNNAYAPPSSDIPETFEPNSSALLFDEIAPSAPGPELWSFIEQPDVPSFQENFVPPQVAIPEAFPIATAQTAIPDDFSIDAFFGGEPDMVPAPEQKPVECPDDLLSDALFGPDFSLDSQDIAGGEMKASFDRPHPSPLPAGEGAKRRFTNTPVPNLSWCFP
ncbi:FHA domain-containing protein [Methylomagnum sp.]